MKWCRHRTTKVRGYWLKPPYDRIFIGCDPRDGMTRECADQFDAFVNVSDTPCSTFYPSRPGQHMHWYPVNECGRWNLSYFFWLVKVLEHHYAMGHKIYMHCHAGAYRSPSAAALWLLYRRHSEAQVKKILGRKRKGPVFASWERDANVPKLVPEMFKLMRKHPTWSLGSILHETRAFWDVEVLSGENRRVCLIHRYFWFYYKPKWWIKEQWRIFRSWLNREGLFRESRAISYGYRRKYFWAWRENAEPMDPKAVSGRRWSPKRYTFVKVRKK